MGWDDETAQLCWGYGRGRGGNRELASLSCRESVICCCRVDRPSELVKTDQRRRRESVDGIEGSFLQTRTLNSQHLKKNGCFFIAVQLLVTGGGLCLVYS